MSEYIPENIYNQTNANKKAWQVCLIGALYFLYIFIQMTKFNAIGNMLMMDFKISSAELGVISSAYFWGNLIFLIPAGLLLDRYSTKNILLSVMLITIVSIVIFAYAKNASTAAWCFLATGIAGSFALLIPLRLASRWFKPEKMAFVSGVIITVGFLGAIISQAPLTWLAHQVGWRYTMFINAGFGALLFILMAYIIEDFPIGANMELSKENSVGVHSLFAGLKIVVANKQNWVFGIYTCLLNLSIFIFGAVFGARFLIKVHHISSIQSSTIITIMFLGAMLGSPVFGYISDKIGFRKLPMFFGALISFGLLTVVIYKINMNLLELYGIFFGIGFFTSTQVLSYPVITESNKHAHAATALSLASTLIMSGGAIFLPLFGWLLDLSWDHTTINGTPVYSTTDYQSALWLLLVTCCLSIMVLFFGKETRCKNIS